MTSKELWRWDAVDLAAAIRQRSISSREAVRACLDRLDAVNPRLNAVVDVLRESALTEADAADAKVKRGEALGLLHGVPVTIKENIDQVGLPTVNGVSAYLSVIAKEDSPPAANWKRAGAVVIGRTNTPAFSYRWDTDNAPRGRTYNPWARGRVAGGSSGGAAAAVAAGIGPLAHGNDYGGSIRYPAYCCGVAGIRPSLGRVPAFNPTSPTERPPTAQLFSVQGPIARRIRDVRLGLAAMAVRDPRDPWWVPAPLDGPPPARPIRVGVCKAPKGMRVDARVQAGVEKAALALADAGHAVEAVEAPDLVEAGRLAFRTVMAEVRRGMMEQVNRDGDPGIIKALALWSEALADMNQAEYMAALAQRARHLRDWMLMFERHPLMLLPTSGEIPFEIGFDTRDLARTRDVLEAQGLLIAINLLGLPSAQVPVGTTAADGAPGGLPLGVQIVAGRYREDLALDAAEIVEAKLGLATPIDPTG
jgi:amidase